MDYSCFYEIASPLNCLKSIWIHVKYFYDCGFTRKEKTHIEGIHPHHSAEFVNVVSTEVHQSSPAPEAAHIPEFPLLSHIIEAALLCEIPALAIPELPVPEDLVQVSCLKFFS